MIAAGLSLLVFNFWNVLLDAKGLDGEQVANALNAAALKGHVEIIRRLLAAGAVISDTDMNGNAAVHSAVIEYV